MRDLWGYKRKRVKLMCREKKEFGHVANYQYSIHIYILIYIRLSNCAFSLYILLWKGKLEIAQLNCSCDALVQNNTTKPRQLDSTFQQYVQGSPL